MNTTFYEGLEKNIGKKLHLRINNNRTTMLSVKWERRCTKVSMHKMFLEAPKTVMESLVAYLRREDKQMATNIKSFINENLKNLDYSDRLDKNLLVTRGETYDLQHLYQGVRAEYFDRSLELYITWFGQKHQRNRSRVTFGLFHDQLRLIKIHRMMDDPYYPEYFVRYVIYHEMLHAVCPPYYDEKGRQQIHSREFKQKERLFKEYSLAQKWLKHNKQGLFH